MCFGITQSSILRRHKVQDGDARKGQPRALAWGTLQDHTVPQNYTAQKTKKKELDQLLN